MRYIRTYEELKLTPEEGDYVVFELKRSHFYTPESDQYLVGLVLNRSRIFTDEPWSFLVKLDKTFDDVNQIQVPLSSIIYTSKDKEEAEAHLDAIKYNL